MTEKRSSSLGLGILYMLGFAFIVAVMAPVIQHVLTLYSVIVLFFLVSCVRILGLILPFFCKERSFVYMRTENIKLHSLYALCYTGQLMLYFASLGYIPIFEAIVLFQCWPLLVPIFNRLFLGERAGYKVYGGILLGLCGVVFVVWQPGAVFHWNIGIGIALAAAACNALASLFNGILTKKRESVKSVVGWNMMLCLVLATIFEMNNHEVPVCCAA